MSTFIVFAGLMWSLGYADEPMDPEQVEQAQEREQPSDRYDQAAPDRYARDLVTR